VDVTPGTIVIFGDIACPWAHVCVHRLHRTRARLGLQDDVRFDMRAFPLEVFNRRATPKRILDAEIPVAGALEPEAGWQMWQRPEYDFPVTTLLALEAVQAAKLQGTRAAECLDRALREAMFGHSRNVSLRHEILDIAASCVGVDAGELREELDCGSCRHVIFEHCAIARDHVTGSPHVFLPDGTDVHNPGISMEWMGVGGRGLPVVQSDDPGVYDDILKRAATTTADGASP
jgi:predicted DsbA family dithiol-disulfide isomerase